MSEILVHGFGKRVCEIHVSRQVAEPEGTSYVAAAFVHEGADTKRPSGSRRDRDSDRRPEPHPRNRADGRVSRRPLWKLRRPSQGHRSQTIRTRRTTNRSPRPACTNPPPERFEAHAVRDVPLDAIQVQRALPVKGRRLVGPWCFLDRFGPVSLTDANPMDVAPHPHMGLQTVTWLIEGEMVHLPRNEASRDHADDSATCRPTRARDSRRRN